MGDSFRRRLTTFLLQAHIGSTDQS